MEHSFKKTLTQYSLTYLINMQTIQLHNDYPRLPMQGAETQMQSQCADLSLEELLAAQNSAQFAGQLAFNQSSDNF